MNENNEMIFYEGIDGFEIEKYNIWQNLIKHYMQMSKEKRIPIKTTFEITPECNLQCKMCYIRLNKNEMNNIGKLLNADQWIKIAEEAKNEGALFILITGGEPLLHPEFIKIYTAMANMGFMIELYTNAVWLSDEIIKTFKEYPPSHISVTLYGSSNEMYEKVCGKKNIFDKVYKNINILKTELPQIPIGLRTVIIKDNLHDVEAMREISKQLNMFLSVGIATIKPVRGAVRPDFDNIRLSYKETIDLFENMLPYIKDKRILDNQSYYIKINKKYFNNEFDKEKIIDKIDNNDKKLKCLAALNSCVISWDGKMLPCVIFSSPYFRPLEIGFKNSWENLKKIKDTITIPDRCFKCNHRYYCGNCPAYVQTESGTYFDNEKYNCKYNEICT